MVAFDPKVARAGFDEAALAWASIQPLARTPTGADLARWTATYQDFVECQTALVRAGEWVHGPADLMHILGVAHDELVHSRAVGWLLDPAARHGLGDEILVRILAAGWPGELMPSAAAAIVSLEVSLYRTRSDVVVRIGPTVLVLENKVMAPEHPGQCENLYLEWLRYEPGSDIRFLLLSLDGHAPLTTISRDAADAWRSMSYASLGALLDDVLMKARASRPDQAVLHESARQYAATLRTFGGGHAGFQLRIGGGYVG